MRSCLEVQRMILKKFVYDELDLAIADLNRKPEERGRIAKGTALAIKMRASLYWGDLEQAMKAARDIQNLDLYKLDPDFLTMFSEAGVDSEEIIYAMQHVRILMLSIMQCVCLIIKMEDGLLGYQLRTL